MFTGIIEAMAEVQEQSGTQLVLSRPAEFDDLSIGASIAVSGVCLSVVAYDKATMTFDIVAETRTKTKVGHLKIGDRVNLERATKVGDRLDGHIVQGHVEGVAKVTSEKSLGDKWLVEVPSELIKFCVQKGSITIDGVSLTIASVCDNMVEVALVPHTLEHTTLGTMSTGDLVHIETDIIGRYVYAFTS